MGKPHRDGLALASKNHFEQPSKQDLPLGPPVVPFLTPFFGGRVPLLK